MYYRYQNIPIEKLNVTGSQYYRNNVYPTIAPSNQDYYVITTAEDRLDLMAFDFYQDASLWWVIAKANNIGKGTWFVNPGILLRIPRISSGFNLLEELEIYQREYR